MAQKQPPRKKKPFLLKSTWEPDQSKLPTEVLEIIEKDLQTLKQLHQFQDCFLLLRRRVGAVLVLLKNKSLVIKPANKGIATVIVDRM